MTELRNCPFCGGKAKMVEAKVTACTYGYYVECASEMPCPCRHPHTECFDTEDKAAKAWNGNNDDEIALIFNSIADYNGLQGTIQKWIEHGDKEVKLHELISCPLEMVYPIEKESASKTFEKAYNLGQLQIIWMVAVLMYGDYGTSPRFGWIEDWEKCKSFFIKSVLIGAKKKMIIKKLQCTKCGGNDFDLFEKEFKSQRRKAETYRLELCELPQMA